MPTALSASLGGEPTAHTAMQNGRYNKLWHYDVTARRPTAAHNSGVGEP
jgi:hypothetical protein